MQETPHRPWRASRTVRFGRNVLWNLLGQAGLLALGFLLVPLLIRELGAAAAVKRFIADSDRTEPPTRS